MQRTHGMTGKSGNAEDQKPKRFLLFGADNLEQSYPHRYPQHCPHLEDPESPVFSEPLGEPLSIEEVARLIGCSPWTVRQRCLRAGLPHLRLAPQGKLIFYRNQVICWLLVQQQKGGTIR